MVQEMSDMSGLVVDVFAPKSLGWSFQLSIQLEPEWPPRGCVNISQRTQRIHKLAHALDAIAQRHGWRVCYSRGSWLGWPASS